MTTDMKPAVKQCKLKKGTSFLFNAVYGIAVTYAACVRAKIDT